MFKFKRGDIDETIEIIRDSGSTTQEIRYLYQYGR